MGVISSANSCTLVKSRKMIASMSCAQSVSLSLRMACSPVDGTRAPGAPGRCFSRVQAHPIR
jgi:hypothetical protein